MRQPRQQFISEGDTVAVFTINVDHEPKTVQEYKEFFYNDRVEDDFVEYGISNGELTTYTRGNFDVELTKVESISEGYTPKEYPYKDYIHKSFYVIEPRLEKIVSAKYENIVDTLERDIKTLTQKLVRTTSLHNKAIKNIVDYNSLPWWKKIFTFKI